MLERGRSIYEDSAFGVLVWMKLIWAQWICSWTSVSVFPFFLQLYFGVYIFSFDLWSKIGFKSSVTGNLTSFHPSQTHLSYIFLLFLFLCNFMPFICWAILCGVNKIKTEKLDGLIGIYSYAYPRNQNVRMSYSCFRQCMLNIQWKMELEPDKVI